MALAPIAFIAPNYRDFNNYWLKAYEPGTTTAKAMSLDSEGSVVVAKLEVNEDGFLKSSGGAMNAIGANAMLFILLCCGYDCGGCCRWL